MRRIVLVGLVGGAAIGTVLVLRLRRLAASIPAVTAVWPPLRLATAPAEPAAPVRAPVADPAERPEWVPSVGGQCPVTHPVKGNANSRIYHVPGGRYYAATVPERCYRDAAAAEADGMRASKR
jgi:hypothetical protein